MTEDIWLFTHIENEHGNYVREKINKEIQSIEKGIQLLHRNIHTLNQNMNQTIDTAQQKQILQKLENHYALEKNFQRKRRNMIIDKYHVYICCSPHVRDFLLRMGSELKDAMPYIDISDIYIGLILVAYSMLGEQYYDMIHIRDVSEDTKNVFFGITTGDIIHHNKNLSSEIRKFFIENTIPNDDSSDSSNYGTPPEYQIPVIISDKPHKKRRNNDSPSPRSHKKQRTFSGGKKKNRKRHFRQTKKRTK